MDYQATRTRTRSRSTGNWIAKGDMWPLGAAEVSEPPADAQGLSMERLSATARAYLRDLCNKMSKEVGQVEGGRYRDARRLLDPGWGRAKNKRELPVRILRSGRIGIVKNTRERVEVFAVIENVSGLDQQVEKSRRVWGGKGFNLLFQDPSWVPRGSPASLALLDLYDSILHGRRSPSFWDDTPDGLCQLC